MSDDDWVFKVVVDGVAHRFASGREAQEFIGTLDGQPFDLIGKPRHGRGETIVWTDRPDPVRVVSEPGYGWVVIALGVAFFLFMLVAFVSAR